MEENILKTIKLAADYFNVLEVAERDDCSLWAIIFDKDNIIHFQPDDERRILVLSVKVAKQVDSVSILENILMYNSLWQQTKGGMFGLNGNKDITFYYGVSFDMFEVSYLTRVIENLLSHISNWRNFIETMDESSSVPFFEKDFMSLRV